jgi:hypothetical protein
MEWKNPNIQRLVQCMPIGSRLGTDIQVWKTEQNKRHRILKTTSDNQITWKLYVHKK